MPRIDIVFTTTGMKDLTKACTKASNSFAKMNSVSSGSGLGRTARDLVLGATYLNNAAANLRKAAADLLKIAKATNPASLGNPASAKPAKKPAQTPQQQFWQKVRSLIFSTRIGVNNGKLTGFPLIGRLLAILPPQAQAIAAVGAAAIGAAKMLFDLTENAARAGEAFSHLRNQLGSNAGTSAALGNIGASLGFSQGEIGSLANALQSAISSDPVAKAFAARFGVQNIGGAFGNQDYGKQLLKVIDGLRGIKDREERIRTARALGVPELANAATMSDSQYRRVKGDTSVTAKIFDSDFETQSADLISALGRVGQAFSNVLVTLGKPFIADFTDFLNNLADGLNALADFLNSHGDSIREFVDWVMKFAGLGGGFGGGSRDANSDLNDALHRNSDATDRNTNALRALKGTFGRGDRAAAIPSGANGEFLRRGLEAGGFKFGQF